MKRLITFAVVYLLTAFSVMMLAGDSLDKWELLGIALVVATISATLVGARQPNANRP